ncbi:HAD-IIB family hydrolase [Staphylococcus capitis]
MNFIFDIDGTICFDGHHVDQSIKHRLVKLKNAHNNVIFASARPIRDLLPVIPEFADYTLIGGNGAIISQNGQIEIISEIDVHDITLIKQIIKQYNLTYIIDDKFNYSTNLNADTELYQRIDPNRTAQSIHMDAIKDPIKAILLNIKSEEFDTIANTLETESNGVELIHHYNESYIDVTAQGIDKHTTIQYILGADADYIAFGNDHNDIHILNNASHGYFVSNANVEYQSFLKNPNIEVINNTNEAICNVLDKYL